MARSTSASTTSATPTETFSDLMSKFMTHSPSSDLTWKQKDTPAEYSLDATSYASQHLQGPSILISRMRHVHHVTYQTSLDQAIHNKRASCFYLNLKQEKIKL